jgi:ABC-type glucose/galactose transport system permease subunit
MLSAFLWVIVIGIIDAILAHLVKKETSIHPFIVGIKVMTFLAFYGLNAVFLLRVGVWAWPIMIGK